VRFHQFDGFGHGRVGIDGHQLPAHPVFDQHNASSIDDG
jgi:hypothetical protein